MRALLLPLLATALLAVPAAARPDGDAAAPPPSLRVRVAGPDGAPVAGATVTTLAPRVAAVCEASPDPRRLAPPDAPAPLATARTDTRGTAVLAGPATGPVEIVVAAPGFATEDVETAWTAGDPPHDLVVRLRRGHTLAGCVRDRAGRPLSGFTVVVSPETADRGPAPPGLVLRRASAADATFALDGLSAGTWRVEAWSAETGFADGEVVRVPDVTTHDVVVPCGAEVRGRVLDAASATPLAGAVVEVLAVEPGPTGRALARVTTSEDGTFAARWLPSRAAAVMLRVSAAGRAPYRVAVGRPLGDGDVEVRDLPLAAASAEDVAPVRPPTERAPPTESPTRDVVQPLPRVRGRVTSRIGLPVAGARVTVGAEWSLNARQRFTRWDVHPVARVGDDGTFEVPLAPPQTWSLGDTEREGLVVCVEAEGHAPAFSLPLTRADVAAGRAVELAADAGARVGGRLTWADTGAPAPGVEIEIRPDRRAAIDVTFPPTYAPPPARFVGAVTDAEGRWEIARMVPGRYRIAAGGVGARTAEAGMSVGRGETLDLALDRGVTVAGVVLRRDGAPVEDACVRLLRRASRGASPEPVGLGSRTGPGGAFAFLGLAAGDYAIDVVPPRGSDLGGARGVGATPGAAGLRVFLPAR